MSVGLRVRKKRRRDEALMRETMTMMSKVHLPKEREDQELGGIRQEGAT